MTIDDLEAFCACWNRHDIEGLMSFMTDDCVFMSSAEPDTPAVTRFDGASWRPGKWFPTHSGTMVAT